MRRSSILIQFILILLNISVVLSANGTSSSGASDYETDGWNLIEKIQIEISEKLNSEFKEKRIFAILDYVRALHSEFKQLNPGSEKEKNIKEKKKNKKDKKKHKLILECYNKIMDTIDQICTMTEIWTKGFSPENELDYLIHMTKLENSLKAELAQLNELIRGTEPIPQGITALDALTASMLKVREGSQQLIQRLSVELWLHLPADEFTKLGENIEQDDKTALVTAKQRLVDSCGHRAEIYAMDIPSIIQKAKDELPAEFEETSKIVKLSKNIKKIHVLHDLEVQMSYDRPLKKVQYLSKPIPDIKPGYSEEQINELKADAELGKFVSKFNEIVEAIPAKISEQTIERGNEEEYVSLELLKQLKFGTQSLYAKIKTLVDRQPGEIEKEVGSLSMGAYTNLWVGDPLHKLAIGDAFLFKSIQEEIQEKSIDLSNPEVFSAAVADRDLKQRLVISAFFAMATFNRLVTLFQKSVPQNTPAYKKNAENILKSIMEAFGPPRKIGTKLYENYVKFMDKGDLYKFKVLVKWENFQTEFKQKLDKLQEEVAKSDAKRMDPELSECYEFLSKFDNLDHHLWKWALGQRINESEAKLSKNKVELENLNFIGAELAKLKYQPTKLLMLKNEAALFGESETTSEPLSKAIYTLHERTNQLVNQLSMEIWLLRPADEFAQLGAEIGQDKTGIRASIEKLVSAAARNSEISTVPELLEKHKSKIAALLDAAQAKLAYDPLEERQSFLKMLNDHSKTLVKVDLKMITRPQLESAVLFNKFIDEIHREPSHEYTTLRDYERLSVVNRKLYEHMAAAIKSVPGSPELENNLGKLWILAGRVVVSLEEQLWLRHTPPLQLLEMRQNKNLVTFVKVQRTMPRSLLLTTIAGCEDLADRIVLRAMHLYFLYHNRLNRIFQLDDHVQKHWGLENAKFDKEVNEEVVPELIGEMMSYQQAEMEKQQQKATV